MENKKRHERFTIEDIKIAYNKLRTTVFYDSGDLLLREQIVEFETNYSKHINNFFKLLFNNDYTKYKIDDNEKDDNNIREAFSFKNITLEDKLKIITERINKYDLEPDFFDNHIKNLDVNIYPKKIKDSKLKNSIISNIRVHKEYSLDKVTVFIKAPIEIHILSVLWTINDGVKKDADLDDECVGNRLLLKKDKSKIVQGSGLFKPYFSQYQKWRDSAVKTAKELLNNNKNTLFINLDIKDYYYSVRIPDSYFGEMKQNKDGFNNINLLMHKIHARFTEIVLNLKVPYDFEKEVKVDDKITHFILPIGLQSSLVIANDYLKKFDNIILNKYKPAYYGRYVDDILLVLADPNPLDFDKNLINNYGVSFPKSKENIEENYKGKVGFEFENLNDVEKYIFKNFCPILNIVNSPFVEENSDFSTAKNRVFKINDYPSLYCQSEKTMIYYFDKEESSIVIDKLKKEIEEKSSEFRDMPNDEDNLIDFEESAYHLLYDGTEDKIRTLKDYKEDRFGLSVYLSHKINLALRKREQISEEEKNKILKFFKGENCLTFYKLWEKILTLFIVNNHPIAFTEFLFHCLEQIDKTNYNQKKEKFNHNNIANHVRDTLTNYLFFAFEMSISLNLKFLDEKLEVSRNFEFKSNEVRKKNFTLYFSDFSFSNPNSKEKPTTIGFRIRYSNMMRHHYVSVPLLNFTKKGKNGTINLIDKNLHIEDYEIDKTLLENSPRPIKFWECCVASAFQEFNKFSKKEIVNSEKIETNILYDYKDIIEEDVLNEETEIYEKKEKEIKKNYLDLAFELYQKGNKNHKPTHELDENIKNQFYKLEEIDSDSNKNFILNEITINKNDKLSSPRIAFANTDVLEKNIEASILNTPVLSNERINKLSKILSKARKSDAEILLFPESFIPMRLISALSRFSVDNQILTVSGIEHLTINKTSFNFVATILPQTVNGIKDATVLLRLKNNYSPNEEHLINQHHFTVPKPKPARYEIINWRNIYFSVCYCFELANITHREKLKSKIDLLIGVEWNKDTPYFSNIVESTSRDLHCYVAQVNTSKFGDTRLTQPKETAIKDLIKLKGGLNDTILVGQIDIDNLRNFQRIKSSMNTSKEFKPIPPDFTLEDILKRINNLSYKMVNRS